MSRSIKEMDLDSGGNGFSSASVRLGAAAAELMPSRIAEPLHNGAGMAAAQSPQRPRPREPLLPRR